MIKDCFTCASRDKVNPHNPKASPYECCNCRHMSEEDTTPTNWSLRGTAEEYFGCEYCDGGKPLVTGKTNDYGITMQYPNRLIAYGYDIHGTGSNGLVARIKYCPMCGKKLKG